ncbi:MAG TPA: hypothetical protein VJL58_05295 [Pyrinomonadaceae bacterium]|nr:hypothetical protein [Pyrinomonadaceae bacterium]
MRRICIILVGFILSSAAVFAQESDAPKKIGVAEIYLAKDDGTGNAGPEADYFVPTDVPIYCVVQLDSARPVTVRMNLVAVSVAGVRAETKVVSTSYTTKDQQNRVSFTGKPYGNWVVGKYRADIYVDNDLAGSRDFVIQRVITPKEAVKPIVKPHIPAKARLAKRT